jgi:hypothetical protein
VLNEIVSEINWLRSGNAVSGAPPAYCMFLLNRFEPQITAIQIANIKANPTITIFIALLRSSRLVPSAKHTTSSFVFWRAAIVSPMGCCDQTA